MNRRNRPRLKLSISQAFFASGYVKLIAAIAFAACIAGPASARLECDVTDNDDPGYYYEVTGNLVLQHWPDGER